MYDKQIINVEESVHENIYFEDNELKYADVLAEFIEYFQEGCRKYYFVVDKITHSPLPFESNFKYNFANHAIVNYVNKNILKHFDERFLNKSKTIAVLDIPIIRYRMFIPAGYRIKESQRYAYILNLMINYLFVQENKIVHEKASNEQIECIIRFINKWFCFDENQMNKAPLFESDLLMLIKSVLNKYSSKRFKIKFKSQLTIYSDGLKQAHSNSSYKLFKQFIKEEIKYINRKKAYLINAELVIKYQNSEIKSINELINIIVKKEKGKISRGYLKHYLYNHLEEIQKSIPFLKLGNYNIPNFGNQILFSKRKKENTEQLINQSILRLFKLTNKITVKSISEDSKLSEITVKRYWVKYKQIIKEHNNLNK